MPFDRLDINFAFGVVLGIVAGTLFTVGALAIIRLIG